MTRLARVGVVLLNWNSGGLTAACIESLLGGTLIPDRIVVVDNASGDGSPDELKVRFPTVDLIRSDRNLGFAKGTNLGIARLLAAGLEQIWVLNNDTIVGSNCLSELTAALAADPDVAAVTGKILYESPPGRIWYAGARWRRWSLTAPHRGQGQQDRGQFDVPCDVGFMSGCCMLVRSPAFATIGLFDESFFAYYEDADWCLRAIENGLRLRYIPKATSRHAVGASVRRNTMGKEGGRSTPFFYYLLMRNRLLMLRKHGRSVLQWAVVLGALGLRVAWLSAGLTILRRWQKLKGVWRGLADGWRQNPRWASPEAWPRPMRET